MIRSKARKGRSRKPTDLVRSALAHSYFDFLLVLVPDFPLDPVFLFGDKALAAADFAFFETLTVRVICAAVAGFATR